MLTEIRKSPCNLVDSKAFAIIIFCCLGFIIYSNTFNSPFNFDDQGNIVENLRIRNLSDFKTIWQISPTRFLTFLSLSFNYHLHQLNVFGYHLFNLITHLGATILAWWLTLLTFSTPEIKDKEIAKHSKLIALLAGLVFLAHPIQTQGVTYIIQRAASLATMFYLASLCLYAKARLLQLKEEATGAWGFYYAGSLIAAAGAMLTKEITPTLPFMIALYEFCFLKAKKGLNWKMFIPFLAILSIFILLIFTTKSVDFLELKRTQETNAYISPWNYLLTQFRVINTYIRLSFLPINQNLDYDYPIAKSLSELPIFGSFIFLVTILIIAFKIFSKYRLISLGIFWFFLTLLPESSFIPIKDVIFEHRLYLAMFGYCLFLVSAAYYLLGTKDLWLTVVILVCLAIFYSVLTYKRNLVWKNELSLWDDTVRKSPLKARPHNNRGNAYLNKGNLTQALADYNKAIEISPDYAKAYNNRGNVYSQKGDFDQAISDYNKAIELDRKFVNPYHNRGNAYLNKGDLKQALADCNKAIEIDPNYTGSYNTRGTIYVNQGDLAYALADFSRVIQIDPKCSEAYNNRAVVYFLKEEYNNAWEDIKKLSQSGYKIDPNFLEELKKVSGRKE